MGRLKMKGAWGDCGTTISPTISDSMDMHFVGDMGLAQVQISLMSVHMGRIFSVIMFPTTGDCVGHTHDLYLVICEELKLCFSSNRCWEIFRRKSQRPAHLSISGSR